MGPLLFQVLGWIAGIFAVAACVGSAALFMICVIANKEKDD